MCQQFRVPKANLSSMPLCNLAENDGDGFDLIEPSLIQQLKKILDQYPDDDQILKVLLIMKKPQLLNYCKKYYWVLIIKVKDYSRV